MRLKADSAVYFLIIVLYLKYHINTSKILKKLLVCLKLDFGVLLLIFIIVFIYS